MKLGHRFLMSLCRKLVVHDLAARWIQKFDPRFGQVTGGFLQARPE